MNTTRDDRQDDESAWGQSLRLSFRFLFAVVGLLGVIWAASNTQVVPTDSRAVVLRFGTVDRERGPGLLAAFPPPIERVLLLPSADRQNDYLVTSLGVSSSAVVRDPRFNAGMLLTGDTSVVHLNATLFYRITDARAYVMAEDHVRPALQRLFLASAVTICASRDLDSILVARPELETADGLARAGRERLRDDLMTELNRRLGDLERQGASLGITVGRVDLLPSIPAEAKAAFDSVLVAIQGAETGVAEARTQAEQMQQRADQEKDRIFANAQAQAAERVTTARTRTAAITALTEGTQGLSGRALVDQIYADRIGPLLQAAGEVQTTHGGARLVLPGGQP